MAKSKELSQSYSEFIVLLYLKVYGYKKISNPLKVPRYTAGSLMSLKCVVPENLEEKQTQYHQGE